MKKRIGFAMAVFTLILLNGCVWDPELYQFEYEKLKGQIASVELIHYENDNPEIIKDASEVMPFDDFWIVIFVMDKFKIGRAHV